jgi:hypothetical protein
MPVSLTIIVGGAIALVRAGHSDRMVAAMK